MGGNFSKFIHFHIEKRALGGLLVTNLKIDNIKSYLA